jgi:hypothetical protein
MHHSGTEAHTLTLTQHILHTKILTNTHTHSANTRIHIPHHTATAHYCNKRFSDKAHKLSLQTNDSATTQRGSPHGRRWRWPTDYPTDRAWSAKSAAGRPARTPCHSGAIEQFAHHSLFVCERKERREREKRHREKIERERCELYEVHSIRSHQQTHLDIFKVQMCGMSAFKTLQRFYVYKKIFCWTLPPGYHKNTRRKKGRKKGGKTAVKKR